MLDVSLISLEISSFASLARCLASSICALTFSSSRSNRELASCSRFRYFPALVSVGTWISFYLLFFDFCIESARGLTSLKFGIRESMLVLVLSSCSC